MKMNKYQEQAHKTSLFQVVDHLLDTGNAKRGKARKHALFGLAAEVGEVLALMQKQLRGDKRITKAMIQAELGDVLWHVAEAATHWDLLLEQVASENIKKLRSRANRNKIKGEGDNR